MEIWLKENNNVIQLPVVPSEVELPNESLINTVNIHELGEVAIFGGNRLSKIALSSFFPNQKYQFVSSPTLLRPYEYTERVEAWRKKGIPIRLIVTGTNINIEVLIEKFTFKEQDGSRDVYYTLNLVEYKKITVTKLPNVTAPAPIIQQPKPRPKPPQNTTKKHTVVRGDTLWGIAVKYYGNGSKYTIIHNANKDKVKNPNRIYPGQVLIIP